MKDLSLLCNLHAEGPATLTLLRRDGCESLSALLEYEPRDLARLLEWDDARAERFLREAAELGERLADGLLEPESVLADDEAGEAEDEDAQEPELEEAAAPLRGVLLAWRSLDEREPPAPPEGYVLPRPPEPAGTALRALALEGLEPDLLRRLAEAGVRTAEELARRPPLELARALDLGLTRVLRLRFLVGRATRTAAAR